MVLLLSLRLKAQTLFFFFNDTATTEIYTLSLHDALPIFARLRRHEPPVDEKLIPVVQFNVVARFEGRLVTPTFTEIQTSILFRDRSFVALAISIDNRELSWLPA